MFDTSKISKFHMNVAAMIIGVLAIGSGIAVAFSGDDDKPEIPAGEVAKVEAELKSADTMTDKGEEAVEKSDDASKDMETAAVEQAEDAAADKQEMKEEVETETQTER